MNATQTNSSGASSVVLITGAGRRRVGNTIAKYLAERGWSIALNYFSSQESAHATRDELHELGAACELFRADVRDQAAVESMVDGVVEEFGRLDALVNTSSIWMKARLEDLSAEDLRTDFDVNALGTFLCSRAAGMKMVEQDKGGSIITIGDWAIERPYLDHAAYFISKGTIPTMTRMLAVELASRNPKVRVNCIHPGPVMFPVDADSQEQQALIQSTLVKQADRPDAVAQAVEFLIENTFVTGAILPIDGGRSIFASDAAIRERV